MDRVSYEDFEGRPREPEGTPSEHPLRRLFSTVTQRAFDKFSALHHPGIENHISEEVLADFIHVDRLHRLRDRSGRRLSDLSAMAAAQCESASEGLERDLEVHQHVGDYALFMAGLFPEFVEKKAPTASTPLLAYVGSVLVTMQQPMDYYIVKGRSAYSHVSRLYARLDSGKSGVFHRLSNRFEEYLDVMGLIRKYLNDSPELAGDREGIIT